MAEKKQKCVTVEEMSDAMEAMDLKIAELEDRIKAIEDKH